MVEIDDLDKLLIYFRAKVIALDNNTFTVRSSSNIPIDRNKFCISYRQSFYDVPIHIIGNMSVQETISHSSFEYIFRKECIEDIKAALFIASESHRFKAFEAQFNKEVENELDSQN